MKFTIWKTYECLVSVFFKVFWEGRTKIKRRSKIMSSELFWIGSVSAPAGPSQLLKGASVWPPLRSSEGTQPGTTEWRLMVRQSKMDQVLICQAQSSREYSSWRR